MTGSSTLWASVQTLLGNAQQAVFEQVIQPIMLWADLDAQLESGYVGALWLIAGVAQLMILVLVIGPLQRTWPVEAAPPGAAGAVARAEARRWVWPDITYTLIHRLGLFRALMFVSIEPWWNEVLGLLRAMGLPTWHADAWWPGVSDQPWLSFLLYLLIFDFLGWLMHWLQHRWSWWWQLHAVHHSQRHMTMWTDNRNHLLDDVLRDLVVVSVGLLIGVAPAQFVAVVALTQLMESLSHANLRWSFGPVGDRLLVSPWFHRRHHAVEPLERAAGSPDRAVRGVNYGVLFPWWDMLFRTTDWRPGWQPTGLRDQLPEHGGRDYGVGFWAQQVQGLRRLVGRA